MHQLKQIGQKIVSNRPLLIICAAYLVTRIFSIHSIPMFTDEAIYLYWAQLMWSDSSQRFISLVDGKQPLYMWITGGLLNVLQAPLTSGRLVSIFSGLSSVIGLYHVGKILWNQKTGYLAAILYTFIPLLLLHDRLAIADPLLTSLGIWAMYVTLQIRDKPTVIRTLLLGMLFGLALLTKSPAIFFYLLSPMFLISTVPKKRFGFRTFGSLSVAIIIGIAIESIMRLSQWYAKIGEKTGEFVYSYSELLTNPFRAAPNNVVAVAEWLWVYLGIGLIVALLYGIYKGFQNDRLNTIALFCVTFIPLIVSIFIGKVFYSRHMLYMIPGLILLTAYGLAQVNRNQKRILCVLSVVQIYSFVMLIFAPPKAYLATADRDQYIEGWASGYGVNETLTLLRNEFNEEKKLAVFTEGSFGLFPFAVQIEFFDEIRQYGKDSVMILGHWPVRNIPQEFVEASVSRPTYAIFYQNQCPLPTELPLKEVLHIKKPGAKNAIRVFEVTPQSEYKVVDLDLSPKEVCN